MPENTNSKDNAQNKDNTIIPRTYPYTRGGGFLGTGIGATLGFIVSHAGPMHPPAKERALVTLFFATLGAIPGTALGRAIDWKFPSYKNNTPKKSYPLTKGGALFGVGAGIAAGLADCAHPYGGGLGLFAPRTAVLGAAGAATGYLADLVHRDIRAS